LWPFLVLGPVSGAYLLIGQMGVSISDNLMKIGHDFYSYSLHLNNLRILFWIAFGVSTYLGVEGIIRYRRHRPKFWINHPKIMHPIMVVIFNIPMGIMIIMSILRLIDQWTAIHSFLLAGWLPVSPYNLDRMYGLKWLYTMIINQISLITIVSFGSLIMLIREGSQKYSWRYKFGFFLSIITISIAVIVLARDMDTMFKTINSSFLSDYVSRIDDVTPYSKNPDIPILLQQILLAERISDLSALPSGILIPNWLNGIIGIRLIVFIPELYAALAKPMGWKKFPINLKKIIEFIK